MGRHPTAEMDYGALVIALRESCRRFPSAKDHERHGMSSMICHPTIEPEDLLLKFSVESASVALAETDWCRRRELKFYDVAKHECNCAENLNANDLKWENLISNRIIDCLFIQVCRECPGVHTQCQLVKLRGTTRNTFSSLSP